MLAVRALTCLSFLLLAGYESIGATQVEFDLKDRDFLLIPVTIHGKTYPFALDTGAAWSVFDSSLKLGSAVAAMEMKTEASSVWLKLHRCPPLQIGKIAWKSQELVVVKDLSAYRKLAGLDIRGMIGLDFLKNYLVQIHFDERKIVLLRPGSAKPVGQAIPLHFLERPCDATADPPGTLTLRRKVPPLASMVIDIPGWGPENAFVDTGAANMLCGLRSELFRVLAQKKVIREIETGKALNLAGIEKQDFGLARKITIKDFSLQEVSVSESTFSESLLGLEFWRQFNVTFDFPGRTAYLEKSRRFPAKTRTWAIPGVPSPIKLTSSLLYNRALAHGLKNDVDEAISDLNEAARLDPDKREIYVLRGKMFLAKKDLARAVDDLDHELRLDLRAQNDAMKRPRRPGP